MNSLAYKSTAVHSDGPSQTKVKSLYEHVIVVTRQTELEELTARFNTVSQARFYLEHAGQNIELIEQSHARYHNALDLIRYAIPQNVKSHIIDRQFVPQFTFGENDLVITVGPDGLVVNTAKYLNQQPIIAVNPDPSNIEGVLLPFTSKEVVVHLSDILQSSARIKDVTMASAQLNNQQALLAFNDIFIGPKSHVSARYHLKHGDHEENQSSSGIIVSTGAGSTGWLKSIFSGATGIINALGGDVTMPKDNGRFAWDEDYLVYSVREPWPSKTSTTKHVFGIITPDKPLVLSSYMAEHGVIFSDGIERDFLQFNAGQTVTISVADHKARLVC